jgi:hypothetical protein
MFGAAGAEACMAMMFAMMLFLGCSPGVLVRLTCKTLRGPAMLPSFDVIVV